MPSAKERKQPLWEGASKIKKTDELDGRQGIAQNEEDPDGSTLNAIKEEKRNKKIGVKLKTRRGETRQNAKEGRARLATSSETRPATA